MLLFSLPPLRKMATMFLSIQRGKYSLRGLQEENQKIGKNLISPLTTKIIKKALNYKFEFTCSLLIT